MNYSSIDFLLLFPAFCALYWAIRGQRGRIVALAVTSLLFYAYGEPAGVVILLGVVLLAYVAGLAVGHWPARSPVIVGLAIVALIADLTYFKYAGFLTMTIAGSPVIIAPLLPLGISFFTFEAIAYLVDLKRRVADVERSPLRFFLYVSVFPHLISGPIMRPNEFLPQLHRRIVWHLPTFTSGLALFIEGLVKKRLIGDPAGLVADRVFASPAEVGLVGAWVGAVAYTVQIYGDFAGYTDMGRGAARMLGLELPLNFNAPYAATSITDFWRRWHISLSLWLRDYVYIPLGGNRLGSARTYVNLLITMLLGGLWHGAGMTFLAWGGYHGALLALERRFDWSSRIPRWLAMGVTLFLVVNGWVLFRAHDWATYLAMVSAMYVPRGPTIDVVGARSLALVCALFLILVGGMVVARWKPQIIDSLRAPRALVGLAYGAVIGIVLLLAPTATRPFIYFRF